MKKLLTLALLAALTGLAPACVVEPNEKEETSETECFAGCEEPPEEVEPDPKEAPVLKGTFLSGHLGNYWDCPEQAYTGEPESSGDAPSDGSTDADFGACQEGTECTGPGVVNCEPAQLTIRLTNAGEIDASGLQVEKIELFDADGVSKAILPLIDVTDATANILFEGDLTASSEVTLRVDYQGPLNAYELLTSGSTDGDRIGGTEGVIELTLTSDHHEDVVIRGEGLYDLPGVDT